MTEFRPPAPEMPVTLLVIVTRTGDVYAAPLGTSALDGDAWLPVEAVEDIRSLAGWPYRANNAST